MILSDGRRIVPSNDIRASNPSSNIISIHPDFRMIVLANRPGFPFLGNDFFGSLGECVFSVFFRSLTQYLIMTKYFLFAGDLFSCHSVDNPSPESERALLKSYGPDVPDTLIDRLVRAFGELRNMADQGLVNYPYSTREVVNIVKHLQVNILILLLSGVISMTSWHISHVYFYPLSVLFLFRNFLMKVWQM